MKTLKDFDFNNKKVLVRCDFNVPLNEKGEIEDDFRIKKAVPTIKYLLKHKAKVILMSHLEDSEGNYLKLDKVRDKLTKLLNRQIKKTEDCIGKEAEKEVQNMKQGEIILLENLRFHNQEKENDINFAKELARNKDIYINDAFSVSHRSHASVSAVSRYLDSGIGFLMEKELEALNRIIESPEKPFTAVIGGAKISTKAKVIKNFLEKADYILLGGKVANTILEARGVFHRKDDFLKEKEAIRDFDINSSKIYLPEDVLVSLDISGREGVLNKDVKEVKENEFSLDIGKKTIDYYLKIIKDSKTIVWSGPMGLFENPLFEKGTKEIGLGIIKNKRSYKVVGGGDTLFAVSKFGLIDDFSHVSGGGGAMLSFLANEELPGLKALEK
ncbi:MAG: phosphoglycerate kinase [Candidatus Pacebacteria bacterium]|nr:phosphoglycerate kinase [Candidatus Paceibacterota bacterium]